MLFLNDQQGGFRNVSSVSGADSLADGRSFAFLDFDRDGWLDIAVSNANEPKLELFRNRMGDAGASGGSIALAFRGANHAAAPSPGASARDGYGARVTVTLDDGRTLVREHVCGQGFAAQQGPVMRVGIGTNQVERASVRWPSGKVQELAEVAAGQLYVLHEDPSGARDGSGVDVEPYLRQVVIPAAPQRSIPAAPLAPGEARLTLAVSMATWCTACVEAKPMLRLIREAFPTGELALAGVPIDPKDDAEKLAAYVAEHQPPYALRELAPEARAEVQALYTAACGVEAVPSSLVLDAQGQVVAAFPGIPTVSDLKAILAAAQRP